MRNKHLDKRTRTDIDGQVSKILRGLSNPDPPLSLDDVRELLRLDRDYYSTTNDSALREYVSLISTARADHRTLCWSFFVFTPLQYWMWFKGWYGIAVLLIPVYVFLFTPIRLVLAGDTHGFLDRADSGLDDAIARVGARRSGVFFFRNAEQEDGVDACLGSDFGFAHDFVGRQLEDTRHRFHGLTDVAPRAGEERKHELIGAEARLGHETAQRG